MSIEDNLRPSVMLISPSDIEEDIKKLQDKLKSHEELELNDIAKLKEDAQKLWDFVSWLKVAQVQGVWKSKTCRHSINGRCNAWNISDPEKIGLTPDKIDESDNSKRVIVDKFPNLCVACPLYEAKRS
ncbi:hypothetical protein [Metallosphaera cuprina]|uniref:Uncharacterized protein n=1 Tax=Metallosphaera cuprina (strain Ar-4) TaxID=1006006 RepID=F4FYG1_METCR|nr:hypothetical protein [Metallosphaera cuprina]AEB94280.1 conserved hypothetical protein [Metallosphaera cuprina Ar-4]